jgi:hypothetical protein
MCQNDVKEVLSLLQQYIDTGKSIRSLKLMETNDKQCVILVSDTEIDDRLAECWWSGYMHGMKSALE